MNGIVILLSVFVLYALVASKLERLSITAPMVFVVGGVVLGESATKELHVSLTSETVLLIVELTLALLLFADASTVRLREVEGDARLPTRLLLIGLPLTIALGTLTVVLLFTSQSFFPGMGRLSENSVVNIKNKSFSVTAELDVPTGGAEGVIIVQGGRFGGWSLYAKGGKAKFVYNVLGIQEFAAEADEPIPDGTHQVRVEFAYDGGGLAKGGNVTLYYDGNAVGTGRVEVTQPMVFSADETTDIGYKSGTTVTPDYTTQSSRFTGKINWVQIDLGDDDHDHYIDPAERLRVAMARQ